MEIKVIVVHILYDKKSSLILLLLQILTYSRLKGYNKTNHTVKVLSSL